jgi:DNA-binding response OmpR family regulator
MVHTQSNASGQSLVLLAEDDREMRTLISRALTKEGYQVTEVADGVSLVTHLADTIENRQGDLTERYDLIISDIRMPGVFGLSVLEGMQNMDGVPPIILITAFGDAETHSRAEELGAAAMFDKPFKMADLMARVREVAPPPTPAQ